jgi:Mrp family chromosome partitioning ATPase
VSDFDLMVIDAPDAGKQLQTYLAERSDGVVLVVDSRVQSLTEVASHFRAMDASVKRTLGVILNRHSSPLPAWLDRWGDRPV